MRRLSRFKRSTAASKAWMPNIAVAVPLSSPAAAQRCAEGAGLDSGAAAAAQSAMPSIAPLTPHPSQTTFPTGAAARYDASALLPNLHQLDGRDRFFLSSAR
jgi:hypothetical protein